MDRATLASHIDHTVLGPTTTLADVRQVLDEAANHGMNACIPPCYVEEARSHAPAITLATVVGFPHGQHTVSTKIAEAEEAAAAGVDELDVVINIGKLSAGDDAAVEAELSSVVDATGCPVKVIIETALLDDGEKRRGCAAAKAAGAAMVKTSTGFASAGATVEDVELMHEYLPVKASGGIGSYEAAIAMIEAGADRIGASSGVEILEGAPE